MQVGISVKMIHKLSKEKQIPLTGLTFCTSYGYNGFSVGKVIEILWGDVK